MARPERWGTALCLWSFCVFAQPALAKPAPHADEATRAELGRVEIALVGDSEQDPVLFERIRSLFSPETAVVLRSGNHFDPRAVLRPERADTVYLWLRVTRRTAARVYLALREEDGHARYLLRELKLEAGLDEVGSETLAQVAHSSAQALWLRERQTSRQELVAALEHESEPPLSPAAAAPPKAAPTPSAAVPVVRPASREGSSEPELAREATTGARLALVRFTLGASYATHASGDEGWLHEPGAFLGFEYREHVSLRIAGRYLVPTRFDTTPARVRLSGASGELRAGWLSGLTSRPRLRLEMGLGFLLAHAEGSLAADEPKAHLSPAQDFERTYAVAAAGFEWPLGPLWLAAGADLRVPFHKTFYEVSGQSGASDSASLSPGGTLELGMGFEPAVR